MARIRTIKPGFFRHLDLYNSEVESKLPLRVAFAGLWTASDRDGRFRWRPEELKLDCLPFDNVDFSRVLDALWTCGFIEKYSHENKFYGFIPSWEDHQSINNREVDSILPNPYECDILTREGRVTDASGTNLRGREGKGREKEKEGEIRAFVAAEFLQVFSTWMKYKSNRKEKYKSKESEEAFYRKLLSLSNKDPVIAAQIIEQSMAANWAGIFELKSYQNGTNKKTVQSKSFAVDQAPRSVQREEY
jgi:hypothetical protein